MSNTIKKGNQAITQNESLPYVSISNKTNDKSCFGVISSGEDPNERIALQLKAKLLPAALKHLDHLHDLPSKKARQEGEGRGGEVLCVTFSLSPSLSLFSTIWSPCGGP